MGKNGLKNGFTTAELLIAIALIGALAVIAMPTLIYNTRAKVLEHSKNIAKMRLAQGVTMLSVRNTRLFYQDTKNFVIDLSKYTKISKICDKDSIKDCWPYEKLTLSDGTEYNIANASSSSAFMHDNVKTSYRPNYLNDNAAFITGNGTHIIINFNNSCNPNTSDENRTCYSALIDANGEKGPNKVGEDVFVLNADGFGGVAVNDDNNGETAGTAGAKQFSDFWDDDD
jgi:prepilin-type N-terminal cleavage/methylation domain-containing protein